MFSNLLIYMTLYKGIKWSNDALNESENNNFKIREPETNNYRREQPKKQNEIYNTPCNPNLSPMWQGLLSFELHYIIIKNNLIVFTCTCATIETCI